MGVVKIIISGSLVTKARGINSRKRVRNRYGGYVSAIPNKPRGSVKKLSSGRTRRVTISRC